MLFVRKCPLPVLPHRLRSLVSPTFHWSCGWPASPQDGQRNCQDDAGSEGLCKDMSKWFDSRCHEFKTCWEIKTNMNDKRHLDVEGRGDINKALQVSYALGYGEGVEYGNGWHEKKKRWDLYGDCPQVSERPLTKISNDTSKDRGRERLREVGRVAYHSDFLAITVVGLFFFSSL